MQIKPNFCDFYVKLLQIERTFAYLKRLNQGLDFVVAKRKPVEIREPGVRLDGQRVAAALW